MQEIAKIESVRVTRFLKIIVPGFILGLAVGYILYSGPTSIEMRTLAESQENAVRSQIDLVDDEVREMVSDTDFLTHLSCMPNLFSEDPATRREAMLHLKDDFRAFSDASRSYDQIRVIDAHGMELIRVNFHPGGAEVVPEQDLQNKADRYYFTETIALDRERAYLSPFDLNIERGALELPYKPMIRVGMPIYDDRGAKRGIVVVNYLGRRLIDRMESLASVGKLRLFLVNDRGYWLLGPSPEDEWGFMFDDRKDKTIYAAFPAAAETIMGSESGAVSTGEGFFAFAAIEPARLWKPVGHDDAVRLTEASGNDTWRCVSYVDRSSILAPRIRRAGIIGVGLLAYLSLLSLIVWMRVSADENRRRIEASLRKAKEAAEEANRSKSVFLANMSHEIRTPMNAILGFAELLQGEAADPRWKKYLQAISSSGAALLTIINDLLDLSKAEAGKIVLHREPTDVASLLEELRYIYAPGAEKKGLALEVSADPDLPPFLMVDRTRLRQILVNLIGNAIKFTEDGWIRVAARATRETDREATLHLEVADTGCGIPEADRERIFGIFEQSSATFGGKFGGTGLGLSISRRLTELMGGTLTLEASGSRGSVFAVRIPGVAVSSEIEQEKEPVPSYSCKYFAPAKLLIVDDVPENNLLIRGFLTGCPFVFRDAGDGAEALTVLDQFAPDLIITDLKMPVMGGLELLERLKGDPRYAAIPVILLTASITKEDEDRMRVYADSYLRKPVRRSELLAELGKFLPGADPADEDLRPGAPSDGESIAAPADRDSRAAFRERLDTEFAPRLAAIGDRLLIDDLMDLADAVEAAGAEYGIQAAVQWSGRIKRAVLSFDTDELSAAIAAFAAIKERLDG